MLSVMNALKRKNRATTPFLQCCYVFSMKSTVENKPLAPVCRKSLGATFYMKGLFTTMLFVEKTSKRWRNGVVARFFRFSAFITDNIVVDLLVSSVYRYSRSWTFLEKDGMWLISVHITIWKKSRSFQNFQ